MKRPPVTGSNELLDLLDPFIPDDFINAYWNARPVRGPRWQFSAAQLWRVHLLTLLTPVHSLNLLIQLLPEQRTWRDFARLRHRHRTPDARILNAFRDRVGVLGLRQINEAILQPLIQTAALWSNATALIDATDLPAACSGFKKKTPALTPLIAPRWADAPSRPARAAGLWVTRSTAFVCGGGNMRPPCCWCRWSAGSRQPMFPKAGCSCPVSATATPASSCQFKWQEVMYRDYFDHFFDFLSQTYNSLRMEVLEPQDLEQLDYWLSKILENTMTSSKVFSRSISMSRLRNCTTESKAQI